MKDDFEDDVEDDLIIYLTDKNFPKDVFDHIEYTLSQPHNFSKDHFIYEFLPLLSLRPNLNNKILLLHNAFIIKYYLIESKKDQQYPLIFSWIKSLLPSFI